MKKFYAFLCTALLGFFFPTVLCAYTVNVVIDDPERVIVEIDYTPVEGLVAGSNTLDIPEYTPVYIKAKEGCFLLSVVRESTGSNEYIYSYTSSYLSIGADETFTVTSAYADDIRDASCTITVDHASDVVVQRTGTYTNVDLVDGENTVKFMSDMETMLYIYPAVYGNSLYKVTLNGENQMAQNGQYYLEIKDGDKLEILTEFPDITCAVSFSYANDESKEFFSDVKLNGESVENFNDGFNAKAGQTTSLPRSMRRSIPTSDSSPSAATSSRKSGSTTRNSGRSTLPETTSKRSTSPAFRNSTNADSPRTDSRSSISPVTPV